MTHILVVEDERKIADLLRDYLQHAGYTVSQLLTGRGIAKWVREQQPDLVLLDVMLPEQDGLESLKQIRALSGVAGQTPVIMLTARVEEIDRLLGLELGADDYICKPFSPREVVARVKAVLRRAQLSQHAAITGASGIAPPTPGIRLDAETLSVRYVDDSSTPHAEGDSVSLTQVEFRMLQPMVSRPGRIYSRAQLMQSAYDDHRIVSDRTVDSHIVKLRKKLTQLAPEATLIESVYAAGYRYLVP